MIGSFRVFFSHQELVFTDHSEFDLLQQLWQFVYRQFGDCSIKKDADSKKFSVASIIERTQGVFLGISEEITKRNGNQAGHPL